MGFLRRHGGDRFYVSLTALGEFAAGFGTLDEPLYREIRVKLGLLPLDEPVVEAYRHIFRKLKAAGNLIGANDLWIAATSVRHGIPLVTRNRTEFSRVPGLKVLSY